MSIPRQDEIQLPALQLLQNGNVIKTREFEAYLAQHFKLTEEEMAMEYESGNGLIFRDRITWALSHLRLADLVEKPKRAHYKISEQGLAILKKPQQFKQYVNQKVLNRTPQKKTEKAHDSVSTISKSTLTPEEGLYNSFQGIKDAIYREILDTIISKRAREFEKLVVKLLQKMGYGGEVTNSGTITQYTNDGGIDGVIKEDVLGFGRIYIQAKRYSLGNNVSREEVQKFVGALAVAQSNKGIMITTSDYTKGAYEYAQSLTSPANLLLMNGQQLAAHIYEFGLGMQTEQVIELKKMDSDFWDELEDDV